MFAPGHGVDVSSCERGWKMRSSWAWKAGAGSGPAAGSCAACGAADRTTGVGHADLGSFPNVAIYWQATWGKVLFLSSPQGQTESWGQEQHTQE